MQSGGYASVTNNGTLVYLEAVESPTTWVWLDRTGRENETPFPALSAIGTNVTVSPNGRLFAVLRPASRGFDLWVHNSETGIEARLTSEPGRDMMPAWSPDSRPIAYTSERADGLHVFLVSADGAGTAEQLTSAADDDYVSDWSQNGKRILFVRDSPATGNDLWYLERNQENKPWESHLFLQTPHRERFAVFSPNGRFVAYQSDESGVEELYVRPFPQGEERWPVSNGGASNPKWSPDGRTLYCRAGDWSSRTPVVMATSVSTEEEFRIGRPVKVFEYSSIAAGGFGISPGGKRFGMRAAVQNEEEQFNIVVVQNWYEEFRDREQD